MNYFTSLTSEEKNFLIGAAVGLVLLIILIIIGVTVNKKARANGASWLQIYTGKPIGAICANNGMCSTNKCVNKFCVV